MQTSNQSKIRIRIRAYDHKLIDSSAKQIIDTVLRNGGKSVVLYHYPQKSIIIQLTDQLLLRRMLGNSLR
jgi:ribosomal protein S10